MGFAEPDSPDQFKVADHVGSLALIAVNGHQPEFTTAYGTRAIIRCEIAIIDGPTAGQRYGDAMLFQSKLVPQLRGSIGQTVLGRFAKGKPQPGQNAPLILDKPTHDDVAIAEKWVQDNGDVESHPIDMTAPPLAPVDGEQWRVGQTSPPSQLRAPAGQVSAQARYGAPPSAQDDEPPF